MLNDRGRGTCDQAVVDVAVPSGGGGLDRILSRDKWVIILVLY